VVLDLLFGKMVLGEHHFSKKIEIRTLLPPAKLTFGSGTRPERATRRKLCY
jgi:hypothetical protein